MPPVPNSGFRVQSFVVGFGLFSTERAPGENLLKQSLFVVPAWIAGTQVYMGACGRFTRSADGINRAPTRSGLSSTLSQGFDKSALLDFAQEIAANEAIVIRGAGAGIFVLDLIEDGFDFFRRRDRV
jgi:hypothetical protein